jgi:hypothetical protein
VSLWAILPLSRCTNVITPHRENNLSQWMSLSLKHNLISLHPKLFFRGRVRVKRLFCHYLFLLPCLSRRNNSLLMSTPTDNIRATCGRLESLLQSDPKLGNTTSTSNSVIPVANDMSQLIAKHKGVRSYTHHLVSNFVSYQHLSSSYHSFVSKLSYVSIPTNLQEALNFIFKKKIIKILLKA